MTNSKPKLLATVLATCAAAFTFATPAAAKPHLAGVFDLSGTPGQISKASDGNVWVTLSGSGLGNKIARIKPSGKVKEYAPAALTNPVGIGRGPDGNLWLTQTNEVVRLDPEDPDSAQEFTLNEIADPRGITRGPRKRLWTASNDELVSFKPNNPAGYDATKVNNMGARGIAPSGGQIFVADFGGARIIRADGQGEVVKRYKADGGPQEVAKGPGGSVAFANPGSDPQTVGRIDPPKNAKTTDVPNTDPFGMAFAKDKRWWFAEFATHHLGRLKQNGKVSHFRKLPDNSGPRYLAKGKNGWLFVSLETANQIARIKGF